MTSEPSESPFEFLRKDARNWNGMFGTRIKTIKLRGQISQGLLLSSKTIPSPLPLKKGEYLDNLAKHFGVVKWEREVPQQEIRQDHWFDAVIRFFVPKKYRPAVFDFVYSKWLKLKNKRGADSFPSWLRKTDQERAQNILGKLLVDTNIWETSVKLNGSSMTVAVKDGVFSHYSRNVKLGIEDGSKFSEVVKRYNMQNELPGLFAGRSLAIQGELIGPGIQGNYEQMQEVDFYCFDIFSIDEQRYLNPEERASVLNELEDNGLLVKRVPMLELTSLVKFRSIEDFLAYAEGPSINNPGREGVVFKRVDGQDSFKIVSNSYLIKTGD